MRFGMCVDPSRKWTDLRRIVEAADAQGWQSVHTCDHFLPMAPPGMVTDEADLTARAGDRARAAALFRSAAAHSDAERRVLLDRAAALVT